MMMDCIFSELKDVEDLSLIQYVSEAIQKQEIRSLFESFCEPEEILFDKEVNAQNENNTYLVPECGEDEDTLTPRYTIRGQKEKGINNKVNKKHQQEAFHPNIEENPDIENPLQNYQKDVKEIVKFWDNNGFGLSNVNAKQQLLSWLDDSIFLQPKDVILKAMNIACANNKRKLSYVVGILKNWVNDSLQTVEEIDSFYESQNCAPKHRQSTESFPAGRAIPGGFKLDLTAGEE